jgi:hypothetical protein
VGFDIGAAIVGGIEGFLMTGNPIGAGIGALEGGANGQADLGSVGVDSMLLGGGDTSSLMSLADLAEVVG